MERLTGRSENGIGIAIYAQHAKDEEQLENNAHLVLQKLADYEDTNLTPAQIREIDSLYAEKCKEVAELKDRIKQLEFGCDGHTAIIDNIEKANQELSDNWVEMKEENERLKAELSEYKEDIVTVWIIWEGLEISENTVSLEFLKDSADEIGESIFTTQEEAEKALVEMESKNE